jgi:hypothetical protein
MRLLPAAREILRVLAICPWIPIDVLTAISGAHSRVSVYQTLGRLSAAGLVQKRQVRPAVFGGTRPIAVWAMTAAGIDAHPRHRTWPPTAGQPLRVRDHVADPLRISAVRALAGWIAAQRTHAESLKIVCWQAPLTMQLGSTTRRPWQVHAAAVIEIADSAGAHAERIMVIPDLATAPIARSRPMLRRLLESFAHTDDARYPVRLLVVTTDVDGAGSRRLAWLRLVQRLRFDTGASALACHVLDWPQLYDLLGVHASSHHRGAPDRAGRHREPRGRRDDEVLDLVGRHPFLTIKQIADVLGVTPRRARRLRQALVDQGLIRVLTASDIGSLAPVRLAGHRVPLPDDLAELTAAGRSRMARRLGLSVAAARRYHGLFGGSPRRRERALRHLAHTVGANQVFVTLALDARAARARGADEGLEEWRSAAACEHWRCKPDGYGCYRRGDQRYGFLLEYDRGTERARQYDAKLAAYCAYYRRGHAARHYAGRPQVLFVTTSDAAEVRIVAAMERVFARHGDPGFSFLTTTTTRIKASGILAAIWRGSGRSNPNTLRS